MTTTPDNLRNDPMNANKGTVRGLGMVERSLQQYGAGRSILASKDGIILAGNKTYDRAVELGIPVQEIESDGKTLFVIKRTDLAYDDPRAKELAIADNRSSETGLEWDADVLAALADDGVDLSQFWFEDELAAVLSADDDDYLPGDTDEDETEPRQTLADRFLVPPFSVLDARQGYWQDRKRAWLALGIKSELGRGENALGFSEGTDEYRKSTGDYTKHGAVVPAGGGGLADGPVRLRQEKRASDGNGPARTNGQDLMRGEHTVGEGKRAATASTRSKLLADSGGGAWLGGPKTASTEKFAQGRGAFRSPKGEYEYPTEQLDQASGTSIFDPVLCELAYRWFCPPTGTVLDPFAGGSVRGIVAAKLGRSYVGIDLSKRQVEANYVQGGDIIPENCPVWHVGDSRDVRSIVGDQTADFVFSCPPYADLEVYSDHPADLSTMPYDDFLIAYRHIISASIDRLANDRFACFVVGDVRDGKGIYRNFVSHTIQAFEDAGARLYNEAILVTAVGSLPIRVGRQFEAGRKLGKTHQNVLVFVKGDPKRATENVGPVDVADVFEDAEVA